MLTPEQLEEMKAIFKVELQEQHEVMISALMQLKSDLNNKQALEDAFRSAHNLKGASRSLGIETVGSKAEQLESIYTQWRHGDSQPELADIDDCIVKANLMLNAIDDNE